MSGFTGRSSIVLTSFSTDEFLDADVEHAKQHLRHGPPRTSGSVSIVIFLWVWGFTPLKSVICGLLRWNLSCASNLASHALPFSIHWRNYHVINIPETWKIIFWPNLTGR
ncbi:hypothetical protein HZ326_15287 [Fusarium oxysporum f. sp. albedinis]|nr:hypothetical protein HZ326_15287 [Fusarium oxysporum f. sp. albedinis]